MITNFAKPFYLIGIFVFILMAIQIPACADQKSSDNKYVKLNKFWLAFRTAALNGDKLTLIKLAQFPIFLHGAMDDDPIIKMDHEFYDKNIDVILNQDPGDPSTAEPETTLDLFKRTMVLNDDGGFARIGGFEFNKINGRWLWVRVYIEQEVLK